MSDDIVDRLSKEMADRIGNGMREKFRTHAKIAKEFFDAEYKHDKPKHMQSPGSCECLTNMAGYGPHSYGDHHHKECPKYRTELFPYLFYYEDAINSLIPAPDRIENIISVNDQLDKDEHLEIIFQRIDMTDKEFDSLSVE